MPPKPAHTPEPWTQNKTRIEIAGRPGFRGDYRVADAYFSSAGLANTPTHDEAQANANRIETCVNALTGIPDPKAHMEAVGELIQAAKKMLDAETWEADKRSRTFDSLRAALSKIEGGK